VAGSTLIFDDKKAMILIRAAQIACQIFKRNANFERQKEFIKP
jgi:hypothetical protein